MRFLVTEMPTTEAECPFHGGGHICQLDGCPCEYFAAPYSERDPADCYHLKEVDT